jgi:hypothetical protein
MLGNFTKVTLEGSLAKQLMDLASKHFPLLPRLPDIQIAAESTDGPAWLNASDETIYIDERVAPFQNKTTRILILHELIHWRLYLEGALNPADETCQPFLSELGRLKGSGAYTGLL